MICYIVCNFELNSVIMQPVYEMNYCSHCGHKVTIEIPAGDNRPRHICRQCHTIHYQNPKIVCGCIITWQDYFLLCKRAIEPRYGKWTFPAGFMENSESVQQCALRESVEEACADITPPTFYTIYNITQIHQVHIMFHAQLKHADAFAVGEESLEVKLFHRDAIPWDEIAFKVVTDSLQQFISDQANENYPCRLKDIYF